MSEAAQQGRKSDGGFFQLHGTSPVVPESNTLLSLKLLADTNPNMFKKLSSETTKWLAASMSLLENDSYLRIRMGGDLLQGSIALPDILKKRAEERHFESRIDNMVKQMNLAELTRSYKNKLNPLAPEQLPFQANEGGILVNQRPLGASLFVAEPMDVDPPEEPQAQAALGQL